MLFDSQKSQKNLNLRRAQSKYTRFCRESQKVRQTQSKHMSSKTKT